MRGSGGVGGAAGTRPRWSAGLQLAADTVLNLMLELATSISYLTVTTPLLYPDLLCYQLIMIRGTLV